MEQPKTAFPEDFRVHARADRPLLIPALSSKMRRIIFRARGWKFRLIFFPAQECFMRGKTTQNAGGIKGKTPEFFSRLLPAFFALLFFLPSSCKNDAPPPPPPINQSAQQLSPFAPPGKPEKDPFRRPPGPGIPTPIPNPSTWEVAYFYRGEVRQEQFVPFERCTRPGDYFVVTKELDAHYVSPVMGIRIMDLILPNTVISEDSFTASANGKKLKPRLRKIEENVPGFWEISWELDPSWKTFQIRQDTNVRFQFAIQDKKLDWSEIPASFVPADPNHEKNPEICPP